MPVPACKPKQYTAFVHYKDLRQSERLNTQLYCKNAGWSSSLQIAIEDKSTLRVSHDINFRETKQLNKRGHIAEWT